MGYERRDFQNGGIGALHVLHGKVGHSDTWDFIIIGDQATTHTLGICSMISHPDCFQTAFRSSITQGQN